MDDVISKFESSLLLKAFPFRIRSKFEREAVEKEILKEPKQNERNCNQSSYSYHHYIYMITSMTHDYIEAHNAVTITSQGWSVTRLWFGLCLLGLWLALALWLCLAFCLLLLGLQTTKQSQNQNKTQTPTENNTKHASEFCTLAATHFAFCAAPRLYSNREE